MLINLIKVAVVMVYLKNQLLALNLYAIVTTYMYMCLLQADSDGEHGSYLYCFSPPEVCYVYSFLHFQKPYIRDLTFITACLCVPITVINIILCLSGIS